MTPFVPDEDQSRGIAIGAAITAVFGLVAAFLRYGIPLLLRKIHRTVGELEFKDEIERSKKTAETVNRMEPALEQLVQGQEKISADIEEIRKIMQKFAQQLGQVQGGRRATDLPIFHDDRHEPT